MTQGGIQARFKEFCNSVVYDYHGHCELSEELAERDAISKTFMTLPPSAGGCEDVWDDVNRMRTLNTSQSQKRQALHVCPLQLDIVERIINRYSNPGDVVLDPFGGLGTVALMAMKMGRRGYTIELNEQYYKDAVNYLEAEDANRLTGSCLMGRNAFAKDNGIDVANDTMTVADFISYTRNAYGGDIIRKLDAEINRRADNG